jgi:hypothetical protein
VPIKRITAYDGFDLTANGVHAGIAADDLFSTWRNDLDERPRPGAHPAIGAVAMSARRVTVDITFPSGASAQTINTAFQTLMGGLQPDQPHDPEDPRYLVAELADGSDTPVRRPAVIEGPLEALAGGVNGFRVVFVSPDPAWRLVTPTTASSNALAGNSSSWISLSVPNGGQARAWPVVTLDPTSQETTGRYKYRHTFTLTNNNEQDIVGEAFELDVGDTAAWVASAGGASSDESNVWLFRDGLPVPRELVAFNRTKSTMWFYVGHVPAQSVATFDLCYGGTGPGPEELVARNDVIPAFDITHATPTTTTGSTTTVVNFAGSPGWYTNQWANGAIYFLTGALAGTGRNISSSTADTVTVSSALGGSPASGVVALLRTSRQVELGSTARQLYQVQLVERGELQRGLWYLDSVSDRPSEAAFDHPGSWEPNLYLDNPGTDVFNQSDYLYYDFGADTDPFAILDADRCARGTSRLANAGAADGIAFHSIWPITLWQFDGQFKNPNGICTAIFGGREDETRDWTILREVTTVTDAVTLTSFGVSGVVPQTGTKHLVAAVIPADEEAIGPDWQRITGTRTSGGTSASSTVTDGTLAGAYADDQFNEATLVITHGTGAGRRRAVTDYAGSSGQFTISGTWGVDLDDTSRFEVVNKRLVATLRTNTTWFMTLDYSELNLSALSAQALNYPANMTIRLDGGAGAVAPYWFLRIGQEEDDERALHMTATSRNIRVDCAERKAEIVDNSGDVISDVTAYVFAGYLRADGTVVAADEWLPMSPGAHTLYFRNEAITIYDVDVELAEGYLG